MDSYFASSFFNLLQTTVLKWDVWCTHWFKFFVSRNLQNNQLNGSLPLSLLNLTNLQTLWVMLFCCNFFSIYSNSWRAKAVVYAYMFLSYTIIFCVLTCIQQDMGLRISRRCGFGSSWIQGDDCNKSFTFSAHHTHLQRNRWIRELIWHLSPHWRHWLSYKGIKFLFSGTYRIISLLAGFLQDWTHTASCMFISFCHELCDEVVHDQLMPCHCCRNHSQVQL